MNVRFFLYPALVVACAFPAPSRGAAAEDSFSLLSLVRRNYNPDTAFSVKFRLTVYWSVREKEETKKGSITCARGDRFRITVGRESFISDGDTFWNWNADADQVIVKRLAEVDRSVLPSQIFSRLLVSCPFKEQERKNGGAVFAWQGDSSGTAYKNIRFRVGRKSGHIEQCVMIDRNDNVFTYDFSSTAFGAGAAREPFAFTPPHHARIVDMRK